LTTNLQIWRASSVAAVIDVSQILSEYRTRYAMRAGRIIEQAIAWALNRKFLPKRR
jgi:hypothetical protein